MHERTVLANKHASEVKAWSSRESHHCSTRAPFVQIFYHVRNVIEKLDPCLLRHSELTSRKVLDRAFPLLVLLKTSTGLLAAIETVVFGVVFGAD
jgi:hypothetical protein